MRNFIAGVGPIPCVGMVVGEAPGRNEDEKGEPFVGASGRILNEALEAAGANRADFYITNAYKYRPPNNRDPTPEELEEHERYLLAELSAVRPLGILALGRVAASVLTDATYRSRSRGKWLPCRLLAEEAAIGIPVKIAYHPAYTIYTQAARPQFFEDVKDFVDKVFL